MAEKLIQLKIIWWVIFRKRTVNTFIPFISKLGVYVKGFVLDMAFSDCEVWSVGNLLGFLSHTRYLLSAKQSNVTS